MNKLTSDEKINILFKKLNNKSSTNNDIPYYQELFIQDLLYIPNKFLLIKYQIDFQLN